MALQKHNEFVRNRTIQMQSRALLSGGPYSHQKDPGIVQHGCDLDLLGMQLVLMMNGGINNSLAGL